MVIAAFVSFALLLAAWVLAPDGRRAPQEAAQSEAEVQLLAA